MDVGSFLREAREAAGLSQVELAGRCVTGSAVGIRAQCAAIAGAAGKSLAERLADMPARPIDLADGLGDLPYVIEWLCAAALLGAPVPVAAIDLALLDEEQVLERFTDWATFKRAAVVRSLAGVRLYPTPPAGGNRRIALPVAAR